jgi:hypothetical protein
MKNSLGKFLAQIRILNGFENISEYLRKYPLPISDAYYRDLEFGKKYLSLEKAEEICSNLNLPAGYGRNDIFYHLLKDILPDSVASDILKPKFVDEYGSFSELVEAINHDVKIHRQSYLLAKTKAEQTYIGDDADIEFLNLNFDLLPILHYIYMAESTDFDKIKIVCEKNSIPYPSEAVDSFINYICNVENGLIKRKRKIFRIKRSQSGVEFKRKFLISEIGKSTMKEVGEPFSIDSSYENTGIYSIPHDKLPILKDRLSALLAEIDVSDSSLNDQDVHPFFVSILISGRGEYDSKLKKSGTSINNGFAS